MEVPGGKTSMNNKQTRLHRLPFVAITLVAGMILLWNRVQAAPKDAVLPNPTVDTSSTKTDDETTVFAGGCFWGVQAVFQHVKGVKSAISGYAGGSASTAQYETVSTGNTGHAESVEIRFDPGQISYGQLLKVFFSVAHDPTQKNHQGPDYGSQYRSVIFFTNDEQKRIAESYIQQLEEAKIFHHRIVTEVMPLKGFFTAEAYHQNYATLHPDNPYIAINDLPKVDHLRKEFPELYRK